LPFLDDGTPVLAFAHRGGARHPELEGLENTATAFAHAVGLGYRYLETDVHLTRDGVLVAFHDQLLERLTDGAGSIEQLDSTAVAALRVGGREPVPTLTSLLADFAGARFNIDLKTDAAVAPLAELVRGPLADRVLVGSFSGRRLRRFRRLAGPAVATSASPGEVAAYVVLPGRAATLVTGLLARVLGGRPPDALQVPHRTGRVVVASPRLVGRAHRAGLHVHVWTVDDPDEMRLLLDRGVDGLMTDRTDILRGVLGERGLWPVDPPEAPMRSDR
jgi:glycerophosphoryl diester phosphodiesterase